MASSTGLKRLAVASLCVWCVAAAAPRPESVCRVAKAAIDRGDYAGALAAIETQLARGSLTREDAERLRPYRALASIGFGDWPRVAAIATPELPRSLQTSEAAVVRLRVLAIASYNLLKSRDAERYLDAARRLAERAQPQLVPSVLLDRAQMARLFPAGVRERDARAALARVLHDPVFEARTLGTLSRIVASQERFGEAIDYGERALKLALEHRLTSTIEKTETNLGWYWNELGDTELAVAHLSRAAAITARYGLREDRIAALLKLGESELEGGDYPGAQRDLSLALEGAKSISSPRLGLALSDLAQLAFERGDLAAARQANGRAILFNQKAQEEDAVLQSRVLDARILAAEGAVEAARRELTSVIVAATQKPIRWEAQTVLAQLYASSQQHAAAERAFRDAMATADEARADVTKGELRISFPQVSKELYDAYIDFAIANGRARDALQIAELDRARTLAEGLQQRGVVPVRAEPERIARESDSVILAYWLGGRRSWVWATSGKRTRVAELPAANVIERALDDYQALLESSRGTLEASRARGEELYNMLVAPVAEELHDAARISIVADGRLAAFNFETLVEPRQHRYWIEDVSIEYAPSLAFIGRRAPPPREIGNMLLVVNGAPPDESFPLLLHAGEEADAVRRHFVRVTSLTGRAATPAAYQASAPNSYAFLHFVAHGVATRQRPLDSCVILGRGDSGYKLYARSIVRQPLTARLVTISACDGAGRRSFKGEGLVGLAWAFLGAGAHEVIAALWEVNDDATPQLMDHLYAGITAGRPPADALRDAKLQMLRSDGVFRKSRYWAPFVIYSGS